MLIEFINITLALLEGFALIISPCILPILPIILAGSLEEGKKRPVGIILGFVFAFALFTFFSKKLVQISGIDLNIVRNVSFGLLIFFGIVMLSGYLTEKFNQLTQRLATIGSAVTSFIEPSNGFFSGMLFGGLIGLIWTPCAGPILASVIVQTVMQKTTFSSLLIVLSFGFGAALPMLVIALFGRVLIVKFNFLKRRAMLLRRILGAIIIFSVLYMSYGNSMARPFAQSQSDVAKSALPTVLIDKLHNLYPAPPITGISAWINSPALQINELKDRVILIDFWAYSCVNCARTIPYLNEWYRKYHDKGLIIIGVHSPEFDFEKDLNNVKNAVISYGIKYPVALDNNFSTWQNYNNNYWPAHYLIDQKGNVVYVHFGEGDYEVTDNNIRFLLGLKQSNEPSKNEDGGISGQTPETYLGYARMENFYSPERIKKESESQYSYPKALPKHGWALQGTWVVSDEKVIATKANAAIKINFYAGKVFAVMGSRNLPAEVKVLLNGKQIGINLNKTSINNAVKVTHHGLYLLIEQKQPAQGILEVIATTPGLEVYTFTFGK